MLNKITVGFLLFAISSLVNATPTFSNSSVVTSPTNSLTFNSITTNGVNLGSYTENGVIVGVNDVSYVGPHDFFNTGNITGGVHYGSGGNNHWVTISMVGGGIINALDFMIGDGWSSSTTNLIWETFSGTTSTGFGDVTVNKGSIVGWTDLTGFTSIRVAAHFINIDSFGQYQAIALDDLNIGASGSSIPLPPTIALIGLGLVGMSLSRKKKLAK